jgi:hypothetical protein
MEDKMTTRLGVPVVLFLLGLACKPPIDINTMPQVSVVSPEAGSTVNQDGAIEFVLDVRDEDGDALTVDVRDSVAGSLYSGEPLTPPATVSFERALVLGAHEIIVTVDDGRPGGQRRVLGDPFLAFRAPAR